MARHPEIFGGCIRLYDTGPEWHVDEDHHTVGIDPTVAPTIDASGFLTFWTLVKNPIIGCSIQPDETLTARGINAGLSNGTHLIRLRFYKEGISGANGAPLDLNDPIHWSRVTGPYSNLWITLIHNVEDAVVEPPPAP